MVYLSVVKGRKTGLLKLLEHRDLLGSPTILKTWTFSSKQELDLFKQQFSERHKVKFSVRWADSDVYKDIVSPYVYLIKHIPSGKFYVGARWAATANPSRFGKDYKTSSGRVHRLGFENFELVYIWATPNARNLEAEILQSWACYLGDSFKDVFINRHLAPGFIHDNLSKAKIRAAHLGKPKSEIQKIRLSLSQKKANDLNTEQGMKTRMRKRASASHAPLSQERREHLSKLRTGVPLSEEHKLAISAGQIGLVHAPHSAKTRKKMSASAKRLNDPTTKEGQATRARKSATMKARPKKTCPHCELKVDSLNFTKWHGDKCKLLLSS